MRLDKAADKTGAKWDRFLLDDGGIAVEDLIAEDLNGDGKPDIIAAGRDVRIYWKLGK